MKIAVIGAGAMGSIYASFLAKNNNKVIAIDLWKDHLDAINTNGLESQVLVVIILLKM